jgi:hypothetical protein
MYTICIRRTHMHRIHSLPPGLEMDSFPSFFLLFPTTSAKKSNIPSGLGKVSPGKEIGF